MELPVYGLQQRIQRRFEQCAFADAYAVEWRVLGVEREVFRADAVWIELALAGGVERSDAFRRSLN